MHCILDVIPGVIYAVPYPREPTGSYFGSKSEFLVIFPSSFCFQSSFNEKLSLFSPCPSVRLEIY